MTKFVKKDQITSSWYEIDATNAVVGRLATVISKIIRGKNKATYTPHMDHGDFVVVKNIEQAKFTGKKFEDKIYYRHTGHPGGIKETIRKLSQFMAVTIEAIQQRMLLQFQFIELHHISLIALNTLLICLL